MQVFKVAITNILLCLFICLVPTKELYVYAATDAVLDKEAFKIIGASVLAAMAYGILQDQITARVCVEYFNSDAAPHHKALLDEFGLMPTNNPTLIAFVWGIAATWWCGLILGGITACAARLGSWPKLTIKDLYTPMLVLLSCMGIASACSGFFCYSKACNDPESLQWVIPNAVDFFTNKPDGQERLNRFFANAGAHEAAYMTAFVGGIVLIGYTFWKRYQLYSEKGRENLITT